MLRASSQISLPTPPAIVASHLRKQFRTSTDAGVVALDDVSLVVGQGEWVAVTGPSGCGKSTLLNVLGGLELPDQGEVAIAGVALHDQSEAARAKLRRRHVGYIFQQYNLISDLDVAGNVELPLLLAGIPRRVARDRARSALDAVGLAERDRSSPAELSGGQQQRVAIARAVAAAPQVLLADEPTGALDSSAAARVLEALTAAHRHGQTIVMVTHDRSVAMLAERTVRMCDGRIDSPMLNGFRAR